EVARGPQQPGGRESPPASSLRATPRQRVCRHNTPSGVMPRRARIDGRQPWKKGIQWQRPPRRRGSAARRRSPTRTGSLDAQHCLDG
ncbi:unnamed protein product, partial [Prorocentrum cordatum]